MKILAKLFDVVNHTFCLYWLGNYTDGRRSMHQQLLKHLRASKYNRL